MISVAVLPIRENTVASLKPDEIEIATYIGSGPGGQHRNTTETAVRARHKETGITVCINSRSQDANKKEAIKILNAKVTALRQEKMEEKYGSARKNQMGGGTRSDKIRTYNFMTSLCKDHRLNRKTSKLKQIMKGDFRLLFEEK